MHGRIVQIAFQKGSKVDIDLLPIMLKRLTLTGATLRPRSKTLVHTVKNVSGTAAASTMEKPGGTGSALSAAARQ